MIETEIKKYLEESLKELNISILNNEIVVSNRKDLCDYQFNGLFRLSKELHRNPMELSKSILDHLKPDSRFLKIDYAPPGFINITLSNEYINDILNNMIKEEKYNIHKPKSKKIMIDYGGYNIAKPLHVGHLRSGIVGESLKRILSYMGHQVTGDVHLGDYGLQIGQVIYGLKEEGIKKEDITIQILEQIYPKISALCKENETIHNLCANITKEMQEGNQEYNEYFKVIREVSSKDILRICKYLDISFDFWYGESDAYPYIKKVEQDLIDKKLLYQSEGAWVVDIAKKTDSKELPPLIFKKSNGAYLYASTDLGTIYQRMEMVHPEEMIYVADNRQSNHYLSFFRVAEKLGIPCDFNFYGFGTVNGSDGKPYKTRSGDAPKLDELFQNVKEVFKSSNEKNKELTEEDLDILVNAIIKFADLQNNREKDYIFDIDKFSQVTGKTGPYILYTYLRIASILKKYPSEIKMFNNNIYNIEDRDIRIKLLELDNTLNYAAKECLPSILANYIYELCVNINAFYEKNHINNLDDTIMKNNWLCLLDLANRIIKDMLYLLSINIPEKM